MVEDPSTDEHSADEKDRFTANRRFLLKAFGGAAALGGLSQAPRVTSAATVEAFSYSNVLHAVDDLGCDPTGGERIDDRLADAAADGTLIEFPDGTFLTGRLSFSGMRTFGLVAADGAAPTFRADFDGGRWLEFPESREIQVEGIEFDMRDAGGGTINFDMPGPWIGRDLVKRGLHPDENAAFRPAVYDSDAQGLLERCEARGVSDGPHDRGSVGIYVDDAHAGHTTIRDCVISYASDNGIYASSPGDSDGGGGSVGVERGLYYNNNTAGVRLGSDDSYARGVVVVNDERAPSKSGSNNQRGIWVRNGGGNVTVENCDVAQLGGACTHGVLLAEGSDGAVHDCRVENDAGKTAIRNNAGWSEGSGNHVSGDEPVVDDVPDAWIECIDAGCDEPRTTARDPDGGDGGGDSTAPTAPTNLSSPGHTETSVDLDWDAATDDGTGVDHYVVYLDGSPVQQTSAGSTATTVSGLSSGTAYDFHVTAVDGAGNESGASNTITVSTDTPEQSPYGRSTGWPIPGAVEAENYDEGGQDVAYHDTTRGNHDGVYRDDDVDLEESTEHGYNVGYIRADEWLEYTVAVESAGTYDLSARVASGFNGGQFRVAVDGADVTGSVSFDATGGWQSWTTVDAGQVDLPAGEHVVRITAESGHWNLNRFAFQSSGDSTAPSVSWVSPADGATVDGSASIELDATDDTAAGSDLVVEWRVDGGDWRTAAFDSGSGSHADTWDTTGAADGEHVLEARATDPAGNTSALASCTVTVDNAPDLPNTIVFSGDGVQERTTYSFAVSGDLERDADLGSINDSDTVSGSSAEGFVWGGGADGYRYSGEVVSLELDGPGSVSIDDQD